MINRWQGINVTDSILGMILNPVMPDLMMGSAQGVVQVESGADIYNTWKELAQTARQQAQYCEQCYEKSFRRLNSLEQEIGDCYEKRDALVKEYQNVQAKETSLETDIRELRKSLDETRRDTASLEQNVADLEKQKEIYDILRWIPLVGMISEIVAAIDGTRVQLQGKKEELQLREQDLRRLCQEWDRLQNKLKEVKKSLQDNELQKLRLEEERKNCQSERDTASHNMIAWKDRVKYYETVEKEMEHLIRMKADVEEFHKLLADNPPPFQLEVD